MRFILNYRLLLSRKRFLSIDRFPVQYVGVSSLILISSLPLSCAIQDRTERASNQIQAVTLDARNPPSAAMLPSLRNLGVTHITLVQFGFQRSIDLPEIHMNPDARWYSESDQGIKEMARVADSLEMKIILKPHLWLGRYSAGGQLRNEIGYAEEEQWQAWEADYSEFMMHYAHLAEEINADLLVVGTELARSAHERPQYWRGLIKAIRPIYQGQLTYAANWWGEYEQIEFWDQLDFIGVQAYFELTQEPNPTPAMLAKGWAPHIAMLSALSERLDRPILFTEIGYRSVDDAAAQPWRWPSRDEIGQVPPNNDLQAQLYTVFFDELWNETWFSGAILWKWNGDRDSRSASPLDFTPQGKPAEEIIRQRFTSDW